MIRKTGKEIAEGHLNGDAANVTFEWLTSATAKELQEYLRWLGFRDSTWSAFGRDALNVVLANENIKLQTDIRDLTEKMKRMTKGIIWLTVFIAILTFIQAVPIINTFINSSANISKTSINIQKSENAPNQTTETNQIKTKNNDSLSKTKSVNRKETPNK
jgi:hypothetical protein